MKRIILLLVILPFIGLLLSCNPDKAIPLMDPHIDQFETIFESTNYSILKRTVIDESAAYTMEAYHLGQEPDVCILGSYHRINYQVLYDGQYYDLIEGTKLKLFDCDVLYNLDIITDAT